MKLGSLNHISIAATLAVLLLAAPSAGQSSLSLDAAFRVAFEGPASRNTDRGILVYSPKRLVRTGSKMVLISEGTNTQDCHACSGALSIHYLDRKRGKWTVTGEWLTAAGGSTWGVASSEWGVSTALLSSPVLYSEGGGTWQGCSATTAQFVPLLPAGIGETTDIPIAYDYAGSFSQPSQKAGTVTNIRRDRSFTISFFGTENGKSWSAKDRYQWNGKAFKLIGERSLEMC